MPVLKEIVYAASKALIDKFGAATTTEMRFGFVSSARRMNGYRDFVGIELHPGTNSKRLILDEVARLMEKRYQAEECVVSLEVAALFEPAVQLEELEGGGVLECGVPEAVPYLVMAEYRVGHGRAPAAGFLWMTRLQLTPK